MRINTDFYVNISVLLFCYTAHGQVLCIDKKVGIFVFPKTQTDAHNKPLTRRNSAAKVRKIYIRRYHDTKKIELGLFDGHYRFV